MSPFEGKYARITAPSPYKPGCHSVVSFRFRNSPSLMHVYFISILEIHQAEGPLPVSCRSVQTLQRHREEIL